MLLSTAVQVFPEVSRRSATELKDLCPSAVKLTGVTRFQQLLRQRSFRYLKLLVADERCSADRKANARRYPRPDKL